MMLILSYNIVLYILKLKKNYLPIFGIPSISLYENVFQRWSNISGNFWIKNSNFISIAAIGGGAILCQGNSNLAISDTNFHICSNSNSAGGAITKTGSLGACTFERLCGNNCQVLSTFEGQFSFTTVSSYKMNSISLCSISSCSAVSSSGYSPLSLNNGITQIISVNLSNNKVSQKNGFDILSTESCNVSFSTINNNYAQSGTCIRINRGRNYISFSNIINNTHTTTVPLITLELDSVTDFYYSTFLRNSRVPLFSNSNEINLIQCIYDNIQFTSSAINIIELNSTKFSFTNPHFETAMCRAEIPITSLFDPSITFPTNSLLINVSYNYHYHESSYLFASKQKSRLVIQSTGFYWTDNCLFSQLFFEGSGSAIYLSLPGVSESIISNSIFDTCSASSSGGAVHLSLASSSCFVEKTCAINCRTTTLTTTGSFYCSYTGAARTNSLEYCSILNCSPLTNTGVGSLRLDYGVQSIYLSNLTMNKCYRFSAISSYYPFTFKTCFTTFLKNEVLDYGCISINGGNCIFESNNFVNNKGTTTGSTGLIQVLTNSHLKILFSIFYQNTPSPLFGNDGYILLIQCIIDSNSYTGNMPYKNSLGASTSTYSFSYFSSHLCIANDPQIFVPKSTFDLSKSSISNNSPYHDYLLNLDYFQPLNFTFRGYITNSGNFWFENTQFSYFYDTSGSAIYCAIPTVNTFIRNCFFSHCFSYFSSGGGAIYLTITEGSSLFDKVCVFNCSCLDSAQKGNFAYISTHYSKSNEMHFVSILKSSSSLSYGISAIYLYNGDQKIISSNSSTNFASKWSSFSFEEGRTTKISFTTIEKNRVNEFGCVIFLGAYVEIINSNLQSNQQPSGTYGLFHGMPSSYIIMKGCNVINNDTPTLFGNQNRFKIIESFIDIFSLTGTEIVFIETWTKSQEQNLSHYASYLCSSDFSDESFYKNMTTEQVEKYNITSYYNGIDYKFIYLHNSRFYLSNDGDYWIYNSFFSNLTSTEGGAAIYAYSTTFRVNLYIHESQFYECYVTSVDGGAIHFNCLLGASIIEKVCAKLCYVTTPANSGEFAYIKTSSTRKNFLYFVSLLECAPIMDFGMSPIFLENGVQKLNQCNISNNYVQKSSAITFKSSSSMESTFLTISNNKANLFSCIQLIGGLNSILYSNILNNTQGNNLEPIITNKDPAVTNFISCVIKQNELKSTFGGNNKNLNFIDCWYDGYSYSYIIPNFFRMRKNDDLNNLFHFSSAKCLAQNQHSFINTIIPTQIPNDIISSSTFNKYYPEMEYINIINHDSRYYISQSGNFWIHDSVFYQLKSLAMGSGGAIYAFSSLINNFQIERSFFSFCSVTDLLHGGAIYYSCTKGSFNIDKCCGSNCQITSPAYSGHFSYISTSNSRLNHYNLISITECAPVADKGYTSLYMENGVQKILSSNISNNKAQYYSSIQSNFPSTLFIGYSTFSNNFAYVSGCIRFQSGSVNMVYSNILNNSRNSGSIISVDASSQTIIFRCVIKDNGPLSLFENYYELNLVECWYDSYKYEGTIPSFFIIKENGNIVNLTHFSSALCKSNLEYSVDFPIDDTILENTTNSFSQYFYGVSFLHSQQLTTRIYIFWIICTYLCS